MRIDTFGYPRFSAVSGHIWHFCGAGGAGLGCSHLSWAWLALLPGPELPSSIVTPLPLMSRGDLRLGFAGDFAFVFSQSDGAITWVTDLCKWAVASDVKEQLVMVSSETGAVIGMPLLTPAMTGYPVFCLPSERACVVVSTVDFFAPGARLWWQANCLPPVMVANTQGKPSAWLLDLWPCWKRGFSELFPPSVGFTKGVPRDRNAIRPWNRWPLEHCLATLAVV